MDDVTAQTGTVNETAETTVEPTVPAETNQEPKAPVQEPQVVPPKGDLNVALKQERERARELQRKLAEYENKERMAAVPQDNLEEVMAHPMVQELLIKTANFELKEGVKDIFEEYPNLPKEVKDAILKNPRGFVQESTQDVQNALLDIRDYVESISQAYQAPVVPAQVPKNIPIAGNNQVINGDKAEAGVEEILATPPAEWTPEQAATVRKARESLAKK